MIASKWQHKKLIYYINLKGKQAQFSISAVSQPLNHWKQRCNDANFIVNANDHKSDIMTILSFQSVRFIPSNMDLSHKCQHCLIKEYAIENLII